MYRNLLLMLLGSLPLAASAAELPTLPQDLSVRSWTKQHGLPDDSVTSVLQSREGYLWLGTVGGLARFDGVRFAVFNLPGANTSSGIHVTALCEDSNGRLWVGTQNDGVLRYEAGQLGGFDAGGAFRERTINSIAEDPGNGIWLGTPSGLMRVSGTNVIRFTTREGLPHDFVSSVNVARSGTVWITTRGGMCQFRDDRIHPYPFQTDSRGRNPEPLGVYEDRSGHLWAFGDTYLVNVSEQKHHLNHFSSGDGTSSMRIWSLCEGRHGELWIGTSGRGLYFFSKNQFVPVTLRAGSLASDVRALCEDREGNLWLGTDGGGLIRLQPRNMRLFDSESGLPDRPAVSVAVNSSGVWAGFDRSGLFQGVDDQFRRLPVHPDSPSLISALCAAPDNSLWVGTPGSGLLHLHGKQVAHYTTANGLSGDNISSIAADVTGGIWVGTVAGILHRFDAGRFTAVNVSRELAMQALTGILPARGGGVWVGNRAGELHLASNSVFQGILESAALGSRPVTALHEDARGRLWIGTAGGRLGCLAEGRFFHWDLNLGIPEHALHGILSDDEGDLWLSTSSSIYRVGQKDLAGALKDHGQLRPQPVFRSGAVAGSLPAYGWPRACRAPDGKLWFALAGGIIAFDLRVPASRGEPPPILIEGVAMNGGPVTPVSLLKPMGGRNGRSLTLLQSDLKSLVVHFTALHFSSPENVRFRHRLEGYDADWVTGDGGTRNVPYGRLPYGPYTFRVQAGMDGDSWFENEAAFGFMIPVPLWRTGWALGVYALAAAVVVATAARMVFNRRLRRRLVALSAQQAMERERMRIAQDMHDEIGSKLTKISFMSERAINELDGHAPVAEKLDSIARTSRDLLQSLDEIVWAVNPHNDTLEHLAAYLGQYATEYLQNTAVQCDLRIMRGLPDHPLSAETRHNLFLAFEEALNNALKHGKATRVQIEMGVEHACFHIRIQDNGGGFQVEASLPSTAGRNSVPGGRGGNGLRNMHERLAAVGGRFEVASRIGDGTRVSFSVPLAGRAAQNRKK